MPRREIRIERFLQTTQPFGHDTADIDDRRARHLFVQQPVCRVPNRDPNDHDPLHFPDNHRAPEQRAFRKHRRETKVADTDRTQRWVDLMEAAIRLSCRMHSGLTFEAAVLS